MSIIVGVYGRVSDADDVRTSSVGIQLKDGIAFAKEKWPNSAVVPFQEVKSAQDVKGRPIFQDLLKRAVEEKFHAVVVRDQDRLSRDTVDTLVLLGKLNSAKVEVWTYSNRTQIKLDHPSEEFTTTVLGAVSKLERQMTAKRTKDMMIAMREKGLWTGGRIPVGYRLVDNNGNKNLVPDTVKSELVRKMFQLAAESRSLAEAFRFAKANGLFKCKQSTQWALRNRIYLGEWHKPDGDWLKEHHASIVDEILFARAQQTLSLKHATRRRETTRKYLLKGFVFCQHCGQKMRPHHTKKKNGLLIHYYDCSKASSCPIKRVPAEAFEDWAWQKLGELCSNPKVLRAALMEFEKTNSAVSAVDQARLFEIREKLKIAKTQKEAMSEYIVRLFKNGQQPALSLNEDLSKLDKQVATLILQETEAKEATRPKAKIEADRFLQALREVLRDGDSSGERKHAVVRALVKNIIVGTEGIEMNLVSKEEEWFEVTSSMAPRPGFEPGTL